MLNLNGLISKKCWKLTNIGRVFNSLDYKTHVLFLTHEKTPHHTNLSFSDYHLDIGHIEERIIVTTRPNIS